MLFRVTALDLEVPIIATTTQALATGLYFATFLLCVRWLAFSDDGGTLRKDIKRPMLIMLIITIFLFVLSVTDLAFSLYSTLLASQGFHSSLYTGSVTDFIETLTPIITDSVMIFRCWKVYKGTCNRPWRIIIFPTLLLIYNITTLIMVVYWDSTDPITRTGSLLNQIVVTWASFYVSTIVINLYTTTAIILEIWRNSLSPSRFRFTIRVITESGLLYTLTSIITLCTCVDLMRNQLGPFSVAAAINFPVAGIAYNLILIRVAQNRAEHELCKTGAIPAELIV